LYQLAKVFGVKRRAWETHVFAAMTASALGQRFNASTNPVIVSG